MNKKITTGIATVASLLVLALFFVFSNPVFLSGLAASPATVNDLIIQDEVGGSGPGAQTGDIVTVDYTGKFEDGTVFETSIGKRPIQFVLGSGQVIPGWDQGLIGMRAGGKRHLVIPPDLAYGASGYGPIPGNAVLIFEVTMVAITPASPVQQ
jgi:FKBP-type peptidyl-prolyl cis-trans isomerase